MAGRETVGIILAGGRGERARPITLESADYIRSKALIPFAGRRLVEWVIDGCRRQGIRRFHVVAQGLENRNQIKLLLGHGERHGVEITYSRARFDRYNVGSGAATLHNLEHCDLTGQALVLPVDSLFEFSLAELEETHRRTGAVTTVAAVGRTAGEIAGKYGVMRTDAAGLARGFVEKPTADRLRGLFPETGAAPGTLLPTNAGMYLVDCAALRRAARLPELMRQAHQRLDWGGDLLPWLTAHGLPVAVHRIARLGDLGNVRDYLTTLTDVLAGGYPLMSGLMARHDPAGHRIHESSLRTRDSRTGTTLAEKIRDGSVVIGPGVRIGRHVEVGPGVRLDHTDLGDGVEVRENARLSGAACCDSSVVGPHARITDTYLGPMTEVHSERRRPVCLDGYSAVGDGARLRPGTRLSGVCVYPRLQLPDDLTGVPAGTHITSADQALQWAHPADRRSRAHLTSSRR